MDRKKIAFIAISAIVCLLVYLPTPKGVDPEQYDPGHLKTLEELNVDKNKLNNAVFISTPSIGAQDVQIDQNGYIYSGLHDGSIIKINPDNSETTVIAKSQGPIFGIDINKNGDKILLADQLAGIKLFDLKTNTFQYLASQYNGSKFVSPNGVVFGQNQEIIYFTVSSQIIPMSQFHQMLLYSEGSGRIFSFNLKTKQLQLLASELYFVNGIQYSSKENCLYFVETSRSRLMKMDLQPQNRGNITTILQNILGYPDNVKLSESGDLWVAIPALRDSFSNIVDHNSIIRRIILNLRMPLGLFIRVANMKYAGGIKVNPKTGEITQYFFGNSKNIDCISGINQGNGKLYLSSLSKNKIAVVDVDQQTSQKEQVNIKQNQKRESTQQNKKQQKQQKKVMEQQKITQQQINKNDQKIIISEKIQQKLNEVQKQVQLVKSQTNQLLNNQKKEKISGQTQPKVNEQAQKTPQQKKSQQQKSKTTQKTTTSSQTTGASTNKGQAKVNPQSQTQNKQKTQGNQKSGYQNQGSGQGNNYRGQAGNQKGGYNQQNKGNQGRRPNNPQASEL